MSCAIVLLTCTPQNGPIRILGNYSVVENPYAWTNVADHVWLDQPVYVCILLFVDTDLIYLSQRNRIQYG